MDDDEGNGGRSGRVRKKSAKVLEMEEFEQAEKVSHVVKKGKSTKAPPTNHPSLDDSEATQKAGGKKSKLLKSGSSQLETTMPPVKTEKLEGSLFPETSRAVPAELSLRVPKSQPAQSQIIATKPVSQTVAVELKPVSPVSPALQETQTVSVKKEDPKSVIKYLLSSPSAGSTTAVTTKLATAFPSDSDSVSSSTPKTVKRQKAEEKVSKSKPKEKKPKIEIMSPSELVPVSSVKSPAVVPSLKMKITGGSNPLNAQVAMDFQETGPVVKTKKSTKKTKIKMEKDEELTPSLLAQAEDKGSPPLKKTKVSKKKEKLIQDAISAVQQMPNLTALVAATVPPSQGLSDLSPVVQKTQKKKTKTPPAVPPVKSEPMMEGDTHNVCFDGEAEESMLVIAEKEKKKKKVLGKKKVSKEKEVTPTAKGEKMKKLPKRAPTAYMLFCNIHRANIVAENPGIEFAGISRKLGELWQTQSNKQKLQWRRKAQRRKKKCNLISTGKTGKESQGIAATSAMSTSVGPPSARMTSSQKLTSLLQKVKGTEADDAPLSPTKVGIEQMLECDDDESNFSIEPMDVAAHLKLLGESLSIIGMRLQEHKGMIAVQGSLSVLLDSLICACGPLLCLTQQVPGMDGCTPSLHAQTLDSVAYVMPGL